MAARCLACPTGDQGLSPSPPADVDRGRFCPPPLPPPAMAAPAAAWVGSFVPAPPACRPPAALSARAVCHRRRDVARWVGPSAVGAPAGDAGRRAGEAAAAARPREGESPASPVGPGTAAAAAPPPPLSHETATSPPTTSAASCPHAQGKARTVGTAAGRAQPLGPPPPAIGLARLAYLAVTQTPGFWSSPLRVLTTAATKMGSPDVLTITLMGWPLLTAILSASALAAAHTTPEAVLTVDPMHTTLRRTFTAPASVFGDASEAAEAKRLAGGATDLMNAHFREALTRTWWKTTPGIQERIDRVIEAKLAAIVGPGGDAVVDLFETTSQVVVTAMLAVLVGEEFAAASGGEVATGLRQWERLAWSLPWMVAPTTARRLHPGIEAAYTRTFRPVYDAVTSVMEGKEAVQPGTFLDDLLTSFSNRNQLGAVRPVHVAEQVVVALFSAHVNTHASGAWTVAHVAADADLAAAVTAEVAAAHAGRPPPVAAAGRSPTGLPVLEAVWAETMRVNAVTPTIRATRAPLHVAAATAAVAAATGGKTGSGEGNHPGWTIPGDGRIVALCLAHANTGADYYGDTGSVVDPHRFVPPAGRSWQAAEADRRLVIFGGGPHLCTGRRVAEVTLARLWLALFRSPCRVELIGCEGGLPPADFARAGTLAVPTRPVYVRLTPPGAEEH